MVFLPDDDFFEIAKRGQSFAALQAEFHASLPLGLVSRFVKADWCGQRRSLE
jgi:hypothetical protein